MDVRSEAGGEAPKREKQKPGKRQIEETLIRMSENTPIEKINVSALVRACGISRTIFYYYFKDIYDALEDYISSEMERLTSECIAIEDPDASVGHFVEEYYKLFPILRRIVHTKYYEEAERLLVRILRKYFRLTLIRKAKDVRIAPEDIDFAVDFFACGITAYGFEHCEHDEGGQSVMARNLVQEITMFTDRRKCSYRRGKVEIPEYRLSAYDTDISRS